jgi:hypothetical protein
MRSLVALTGGARLAFVPPGEQVCSDAGASGVLALTLPHVSIVWRTPALISSP